MRIAPCRLFFCLIEQYGRHKGFQAEFLNPSRTASLCLDTYFSRFYTSTDYVLRLRNRESFAPGDKPYYQIHDENRRKQK